jgi:hypothetical protein
MASSVTIHGGQGSDTISFAFTVTGTNTAAYASAFATNVNNILTTGTLTALSPTNTTSSIHLSAAQSNQVYVLVPPTDGTGPIPSYDLGASAYALDTISGAASIALAGADTVLVAAINAEATVTGAGANNQVIFVDGNNVFDGSADTGGDTIVAGSGFDTIETSAAGSTTVNSGTGDATIYLNDTTGGGINDFVWIDDGMNTVYANGAGDAVVATTEGQTIDGDSVAGGYLAAVLLPNSDGTAAGNDTINANAGTVSVYDYSNDNTVVGGSGLLFLTAGDSTAGVSATLDVGNGSAYIFGAAGDNITLGTVAGDTGYGYFYAGVGNETLNGAASTTNVYAFGGSDTAGSDSFVGGSGVNLLTAGAGADTLQGGTGTNYFQISDAGSGNANILLADFGANGTTASTLILDGFSQTDLANLYASNNDVNGSLVVTIGNSTTVTFSGITSGSQLQGHVVTFTS